MHAALSSFTYIHPKVASLSAIAMLQRIMILAFLPAGSHGHDLFVSQLSIENAWQLVTLPRRPVRSTLEDVGILQTI